MTTQSPNVDEIMQEAEILTYTQNIRRQVITGIISQKEYIQDPQMIGGVLKAADGMDKQVLTKMRIKVEEQQSKDQAQTMEMVAKVLSSIPSGSSYKIDGAEAPILTLTDDISIPDTVPGEMEIGNHGMTYEQFIEGRAANSPNE